MSLFLADSSAPRSTTVSSRRSYLTLCSTRSGRAAPSGLRSSSSTPTATRPSSSTPPPARRSVVRLRHPLARGRRDGPWVGEPLVVPGRRDARSGGLSGLFEATVAGSDFIDPDSSRVERHQFEVAEQLQARVQVVDPDG